MKFRSVIISILMTVVTMGCGSVNLDKDVDKEISEETPDVEEKKDDNNYYKDYVNPKTEGIQAIDLGLSVKWGDRNIGAAKIEDYGGYYVWGDAKGTMLESMTDGIIEKNISGSKYDLATISLGDGWRLPTKAELEEIVNFTIVTPVISNGVKGVEVKSKKNGVAIFIPYAGYRYKNNVGFGRESSGYLWTGDYKEESDFAYYLIVGEQKSLPKSYNTSYGLSVRPVYDGVDESERENPSEPDKSKVGEVADSFDSGDGSADNPYIIADAAQLRKLSNDVASGMSYREEYFRLKNDIVINKAVLTEEGELVANYDELEQWKPIGGVDINFCGTFDGDNHVIYGLYINGESWFQGLFGAVAGTVCNLTVDNSYIKGNTNVGGIIGCARSKEYEKEYIPKAINCINKAKVIGRERVGGVAGAFHTGTIDRCGNYGDILGYQKIGGIVGRTLYVLNITNTYNFGNIFGEYCLAGLVAASSASGIVMENCMNYGVVTSSGGYASGLIEYIKTMGDVNNCVNYGKVTSEKEQASAIFGTLDTSKGVKGNHLFYLETSAMRHIISGIAIIKDCVSMTAKQMKDPAFLDKLNENVITLINTKGSSITYCKWKTGFNGYPILEIINE